MVAVGLLKPTFKKVKIPISAAMIVIFDLNFNLLQQKRGFPFWKTPFFACVADY